uniref:Uncharacterized protein n=1 Tax=Romanomermis culicivorax TaxID=13658 RepID=A0A915K422_ROMCU
ASNQDDCVVGGGLCHLADCSGWVTIAAGGLHWLCKCRNSDPREKVNTITSSNMRRLRVETKPQYDSNARDGMQNKFQNVEPCMRSKL